MATIHTTTSSLGQHANSFKVLSANLAKANLPNMRFTLALAIAASGATLARADFQINLYSDTNCQDVVGIFEGPAGDGPDSTQSFDYHGHLGSVQVVQLADWVTQLMIANDNTGTGSCVGYSANCCQYAPTCTYNTLGGCQVVDQDITYLSTVFTVCDVVCLDNDYKTRNKRSLKEFQA